MYAKIITDHLRIDDMLGSEFDRTDSVVFDTRDPHGADGIVAIVPFRLYDDDDELYYEGEVTDDRALEELMSWAMQDSGCTRLDVKRGGVWRQEIS
jgi:hypothetical protein